MSAEEHIRTIEIEGQKFEIDTREARKIERFRVGQPVKVLTKNYSGYTVHYGSIIGIDAFEKLPTVTVAYVPSSYGTDGKVEFVALNAETKDVEICPCEESDVLPARESIIQHFERAEADLQRKLKELEERREFFMRQCGTVFAAPIPSELEAE